MKICSDCGRELSYDNYHVCGGYYLSHCKECNRIRSRKWRENAKNKDYDKTRERIWKMEERKLAKKFRSNLHSKIREKVERNNGIFQLDWFWFGRDYLK